MKTAIICSKELLAHWIAKYGAQATLKLVLEKESKLSK